MFTLKRPPFALVVVLITLLCLVAGILIHSAVGSLRQRRVAPEAVLRLAPPPVEPDLLTEVSFLPTDHQSSQDSRQLEMKGKVGSGVTAIVVWDSCGNESYRLTSFRPGNTEFTYKIAVSLGNLCRPHTDYVAKAMISRNGIEKTASEEPLSLSSDVGLRRQGDLPDIQLIESRTLPAQQSLEKTSVIPARVLPGPHFKEACAQGVVQHTFDNPVAVGHSLGVRFDLVHDSSASVSGSSAQLRGQLTWLELRDGVTLPSAAIVPLRIAGFCKAIDFLEITVPRPDRALVTKLEQGRVSPSYFDGSRWIKAKEHMIRHIPLQPEDLHVGHISANSQSFSLSDTGEFKMAEHANELFPDRRPEYIFSLDDGSFRGVVWHRRR